MPQNDTPPSGTIEKTVLIQANPAIVYKALTDARDLVRWFCDRASSDVREGGELTAQWKSGKTSIKGKAVFSQLVPGSLVEMLWLDEGDGPLENSRHIFRFDIKYRHGTAEVSMHDRGGEDQGEEILSSLSQGWNYLLQDLKDYCEKKERAGKPRPAEEE